VDFVARLTYFDQRHVMPVGGAVHDLRVDALAQIVQCADDVRHAVRGLVALNVRAALQHVVLSSGRRRVGFVAAPWPRCAGGLLEPAQHLCVHLFQVRAGLFRCPELGVHHQRCGRQRKVIPRRLVAEAPGERAQVGGGRCIRFAGCVARTATDSHQQFLVALRRSICNVRPRPLLSLKGCRMPVFREGLFNEQFKKVKEGNRKCYDPSRCKTCTNA